MPYARCSALLACAPFGSLSLRRSLRSPLWTLFSCLPQREGNRSRAGAPAAIHLKHEEREMTDDPISIVRKAYQAYVAKDRAMIEAVIADDFHFTSPLDNRINRRTYFDRCWKNSEMITGFDFINLVRDGERVFVTYEGQSKSGSRSATPKS